MGSSMKQSISKNIKKTLLIINIIFFVYIITLFALKDKINTLINPINVAFFMLVTFASVHFLGYKKSKKTKHKVKINNTFIIVSSLYLITIYLIGNATGYIKNPFNIANTIYLVLFLILSEIFRYIVLSKCTKNTNEQYIITFLYILMDTLVLSEFSPLNSLNILELLTILFISTIKNSLLSYTSYKHGYQSCYLYSFIITLMPILAPIYPDLSNYITIVFMLTYSAVLFYNISKPSRKEDEETANTYKKSIFFYLERFLLVFVVMIIFLVSGAFKYSISAVASNSMYPELKREDAIIIEKIDKKNINTLKKDMIVAFEQEGIIVTHRILSIELQSGKEYIITKGDNNSTKDIQKKTKDDIIGIVRYRIPLIGYPSVEISEIKNK